MKTYYVMLDGKLIAKTRAVSRVKAINNVRYRYFKKKGTWIGCPSMEEFDAVES